MLVACDPRGGRKVASNLLRGGHYSCPNCGQEVTVRVGEKRIPHFAHKTGQGCKNTSFKLIRKRTLALNKALSKMAKLRELGQESLFSLEELEELDETASEPVEIET